MAHRLLLAHSNIFELEKIIPILKTEFDVFVAHNSKEAILLVESLKFDMIFADLKMITPDGKSFLLKMKELLPDVSRIILSGNAEDPVVFKAIQQNLAKTSILQPWSNNILELAYKVIKVEKLFEDSNLFSLFRNLNELPTIRASYQQILHLIDSDGEMNAIAKTIESDPSIAAKVLRVANSAYYGVKTSSIKQAVTYLGLRNIRDLVLSSSVFDMFNSDDIPEKVFQPIWQQSFLSSKIVGSVYKVLGKRAPVYATSAALLMNIGMIFLLKQFDKKYIQILQQVKQSNQSNEIVMLEDIEKETFGTSHSIIGGYLLNLWEIPYSIVQSALYHNDPFNENVIDKELLFAIHLAEYYSSKVIYMESSTNNIEACFNCLGINNSEFENAISEL